MCAVALVVLNFRRIIVSDTKRYLAGSIEGFSFVCDTHNSVISRFVSYDDALYASKVCNRDQTFADKLAWEEPKPTPKLWHIE